MNAKTRPWRSGLSILSAVLMVLSQPPWGQGWLAAVALVPMLVAMRGVGLRDRVLLGWLCGSIWSFATVGIWLWPAAASALGGGRVMSFLVALAATQVYGGLHVAVFAAVLGSVPRRGWPCWVAVCWVATETLRSTSVGGVPWGLLGHALWDQPGAIQAASVFGVAGVSFWLALVNAAFAEAVMGFGNRQSGRRSLALAAFTLALVALHGSWRLSETDSAGGFSVQVVHSDWESLGPDHSSELVRHLVTRTLESPVDAELTVWPEASLRVLPTVAPDLAAEVFQVARELDHPLIFGAPRLEDGTLYNALYILEPGARDFVRTYDKRRLVPLAEGHFTAGSTASPLAVGGERVIAPLLCFEALFPDLAAGVEADLLLNPTNDVRVGRGAEQQASMVVFRAVENGIPLLRVANRGPSLLIDGRGRIVPLGRGWGGEVVGVPPRLRSTPYRVLAGWLGRILPMRAAAEGPLAWLCLTLAGGLVVSALRAQRTLRRSRGE